MFNKKNIYIEELKEEINNLRDYVSKINDSLQKLIDTNRNISTKSIKGLSNEIWELKNPNGEFSWTWELNYPNANQILCYQYCNNGELYSVKLYGDTFVKCAAKRVKDTIYLAFRIAEKTSQETGKVIETINRYYVTKIGSSEAIEVDNTMFDDKDLEWIEIK